MSTRAAAEPRRSVPDAEPLGAGADALDGPDREVLARLHAAYAPLVHAVALARVRPTDAEDLVQETFVRAMRSLDTLRSLARAHAASLHHGADVSPSPVGPWLATVARNLAVDLARRQSRRARPHVQPHDRLDSWDREEILRLVRELPAGYAEPLILRFVHALPGPRIAEVLGMTPGSVRVNLSRGLDMLRRKMGDRT